MLQGKEMGNCIDDDRVHARQMGGQGERCGWTLHEELKQRISSLPQSNESAEAAEPSDCIDHYWRAHYIASGFKISKECKQKLHALLDMASTSGFILNMLPRRNFRSVDFKV